MGARGHGREDHPFGGRQAVPDPLEDVLAGLEGAGDGGLDVGWPHRGRRRRVLRGLTFAAGPGLLEHQRAQKLGEVGVAGPEIEDALDRPVRITQGAFAFDPGDQPAAGLPVEDGHPVVARGFESGLKVDAQFLGLAPDHEHKAEPGFVGHQLAQIRKEGPRGGEVGQLLLLLDVEHIEFVEEKDQALPAERGVDRRQEDGPEGGARVVKHEGVGRGHAGSDGDIGGQFAQHVAQRPAGLVHQVHVDGDEGRRGQAGLQVEQDGGLADSALPEQHDRVALGLLQLRLDEVEDVLTPEESARAGDHLAGDVRIKWRCCAHGNQGEYRHLAARRKCSGRRQRAPHPCHPERAPSSARIHTRKRAREGPL